jgi:hypothetical protein
VSWSPAVSGTFAAETTYTATITLTPKTGYTLQGVAANFFSVAGSNTTTGNSVDSGTFAVTFPATEATHWNITWNLNGGTWNGGAPPTQIVKGQVLAAPARPIFAGKEEWAFVWYTDAAFTTAYNFNNTVTGDLALHAKWGVWDYYFWLPVSNGRIIPIATLRSTEGFSNDPAYPHAIKDGAGNPISPWVPLHTDIPEEWAYNYANQGTDNLRLFVSNIAGGEWEEPARLVPNEGNFEPRDDTLECRAWWFDEFGRIQLVAQFTNHRMFRLSKIK